MQIWIHDKSMRKVCALNNNVPGMLPYSNSQWHTYLEYSSSTFDFTIPKIVNGKLHDDIKYINDQMFVSFYYDNSYHVFYVSQLVETDFSFQVTCNNTNLELAREVARPLADSGGAKSVEWYLRNLELLGFAGLEIGVNEISDRTRTLTFESQSGTKLEQLHSLMNQFDAEFIFRTELNRDGTMKRFIIDIYQEADENHHGIGKVRGDVTLYYQSGLKGVQVTSDKTQLFNAGVFTGADGVNLDSVEFEEKNELGQVEFYSRKGTSFVFAPLSREHYPSTMNPDSADNWTRKDFQTEYKDVESLKAYALRTIKQYAYPLMTYTVSVQSSFIENYKDINLGDTVKIIDNNFRGGLALEARVSEMIISFDMPQNNSVVFTNFRKLANKPSDVLQQRIDEIVSKSLPYHVEIRTTNGTVFKNGIGRSTVKPILKQGDKIVDATYRFVIDGTIKYSGMTYDMVASDITEPTALTVSAWVDNKEVASEEVTFLNVSDGKQGPKGDQGLPGPKGSDGRTQYTHIAYANSSDGKKDFSTSDSNREYIGIYVDFNINDSTTPSDYSWTLVKGADGTQGTPGKPGADGKTPYFHTAWSYSADGKDRFTTVYPNLNLFDGTSDKTSSSTGSDWNIKEIGVYNTPKVGQEYTFSVEVPEADHDVWLEVWRYNNVGSGIGRRIDRLASNRNVKSGEKVHATFTWPDPGNSGATQIAVSLAWTEHTYTGSYSYRNAKLEIGNTPTPWMPSASEVTTADYPKYIGQYTNYTQADSPNPQDYTWSLIRGNDGERGPQGPQGIQGLQGPKGDQGLPGPKGADGKTQYIHIAYADTVSGSGFSQTDSNKAYIGIYQDFNAYDSQNPQDYRWSKWKGSDGKDGIPGPKGADGRTPYVHFAYADSADGRTGFSLTQTGSKRYLGVLTNFVKEDSTNPEDYTWNDTAGSIAVGARNLLKGSKGPFKPDRKPTDFDNYVYYENETSVYLEQGKQYIISAKTDGNFTNWHNPGSESDNITLWLCHLWDVVDIVSDSNTGTTGTQFTWNHPTGTYHLRVNTYHKTAIKSVWEVKIEEGTIKTDWTPAIEDIQDEIDSKADDVLTQAQLNRLNEMNSIIKAELAAKASLDVLDQWKQAYQDFVNANNANRAQAEKDLADASARVTKLENDLNDMSERWNFIDSYMAASNEGLVVGKTDNSSSIMFNPNGRISMFSAGHEVMYISQGVIHIENGIFSKTIQIGRYREEQDLLNPDRNVIRYVGGA
ncbi:receptor binding protein [Streptococcus phage D1811]|uniref:Receptor binding protein n=1 Tax=Streptococcus phage D1811 TaxID=2108111 RepID=A0A2U7VJZ7_9CAUD|nr:receptor binding protein [Streptococcus phage D1811]AVO22748.1 receptor binding protein [Streptococcus phage D1811]